MDEPLVLLPGIMCDARLFGPQLAEMSPHFTLIAAPVTRGERIEEIASGLLDTLPRKFALAGHSMGAVVAMELLRRAPDRVTRIALISANALAETAQTAADYEPRIIKLRTAGPAGAVAAFLPPEALAAGPHRAHVLAILADMAENLGTDTVIRQARALQRRRDQQAVLRKCKVPALVLCGAADTLTPVRRHRFLSELIPYADLKIIEDAGHLPTLERPGETTAALTAWMRQPYVLQGRLEA